MSSRKKKYTLQVEDDGLIVLDTNEVLTAEMLQDILVDAEPILKDKPHPINVLLRAKGTGPPDMSGVEASRLFMLNPPVDRVATFAELPDRLYASKLSHNAAQQTEKFKLFRNEEAAREWLAEE